jgi:hypothetical protein
MINIKELSPRNLEKVEKAIRIILDDSEIRKKDIFLNKIPAKMFETEGIDFDDAKNVLMSLDCIDVRNWKLEQHLEQRPEQSAFNDFYLIGFEPNSYASHPDLKIISERKKDVRQYLFFVISDLNRLKKIKKEVDEEIRIKELQEAPQEKTERKKEIIVDLQRGIYNKTSPKSIYEISKKRKMIVEYLCKNKTASSSDLVGTTGQNDQLISAGIKKINENFKKKCKVKNDLIINSKTAGGYRLNKSDLEIEIPT